MASGIAGLRTRSCRPRTSARHKVFEREEQLIRTLRVERRLGSKRLRNELLRLHGLRLSPATVHKVLLRHKLNRLPQSLDHADVDFAVDDRRHGKLYGNARVIAVAGLGTVVELLR
jgi:hypothetical protein